VLSGYFYFRLVLVIQGRLRSGSLPPQSLRASSQPPGARAGSVAPSERAGSVVPHHMIVTAGPGGIAKHRSSTTTTVVRGVRSDGTTGVVAGPPRSSHAAASSAQRRRASISVVPSTAAAAAARRTTNDHQPIVRIQSTCRHLILLKGCCSQRMNCWELGGSDVNNSKISRPRPKP